MNKFLIVLTLLGLVLMSGCTNFPDYYEITLEDGTELTCDKAFETGCGITLKGCNDGIVRYCMTNVKVKKVFE